MDNICVFICKEDLPQLVKRNILEGIKNEINVYEENQKMQEDISKKTKAVENEIKLKQKTLDSFSHDYLEVVHKKKFNFWERYIFKRREYKQYIENEQKYKKEQEEKEKLSAEIVILQEKLLELQHKKNEVSYILNGFNYKELYTRFEICKNADSLDKLELSEEDAITMLKDDGVIVFNGKSIEELSEFEKYITMNNIVNYQIGINALRECINLGLKCTTDNFDFLNNHIYNLDKIVDTEISKLPEQYQEKLRKIAEKIGKLPLLVDMKSGLFSENTLKQFDITSIIRLYRYSYLPYNDNVMEGMYKIDQKNAINFEKLFLPDSLSNFLTLYRNILGNDSDKIDIIQFNKISKIYLKNKKIFDEIINNPDLMTELLPNIKICCYSQEQDYFNDLKNIEDLRNIKKIIKAKLIKDYSNRVKSPIGILSSIFGIDSDSIYNAIFKIDDFKLEKLSSTMEESEEEFIGNIYVLRKFVTNIYNLNYKDMKESDFKQVIDELFNLSENELAILYKTFGNVRRDLTNVYGNELVQCLEKTNQLMKDISEGKSEIKSELYNDYENSGVNYFILRDKVTFIQHVMNAYARNYKSATLDIFSDSSKDVIGYPTFSTSSLNNTSQTYLDSTKRVGQGYKRVGDYDYGIDSLNKVVLLFSQISSESLVCFGNDDCGIQSEKNRLEKITSYVNGFTGSFTFDTVEDIIKKCVSNGCDTSEYVFLFEDMEGKKIKPSAVRVMGDTPSIYEIQAAQKLSVPLVKLELALEQEIDKEMHKETKVKPSKNVLKIFDKLNQNLSSVIERLPVVQRAHDSIELEM